MSGPAQVPMNIPNARPRTGKQGHGICTVPVRDRRRHPYVCLVVAGLYLHFLGSPTEFRIIAGVISGEMGFIERYAAAILLLAILWITVTVTIVVRMTSPTAHAR
jgi:hypothetical protein